MGSKRIKTLIGTGLLLFAYAVGAGAATVRYTEIRSTLQPNTTGPAGVFVGSGTVRDLKTSTITFPAGSTIKEFGSGLLITSGTVSNANVSTITFSKGATITEMNSGLVISSGTISSFTSTAATIPALNSINLTTTRIVGSSATLTDVSGTTGTFSGLLVGKGVTDGSDAGSGYIGQFISTAAAESSQTPMSGTNQYIDIVSVSIPAGDWDLTACGCGYANGATVTDFRVGISVTAGNSATGLVSGYNLAYNTAVPNAVTDQCVTVTSYRVSLTVATTHYLKMRMTYSVATPKGYGTLTARRVR